MARIRKTPSGPKVTVDPDENILVGSQAILRYMGLSSIVTLYQYVEQYGFPAIKRPDGMWMSSITAIDQWIFMAAEEDLKNRPHSRGSNTRSDISLKRARDKAQDGEITDDALRLAEAREIDLKGARERGEPVRKGSRYHAD